MEINKPSQRPWSTEQYVKDGLVFVKDADGKDLFRTTEANAKLIVEAVNKIWA